MKKWLFYCLSLAHSFKSAPHLHADNIRESTQPKENIILKYAYNETVNTVTICFEGKFSFHTAISKLMWFSRLLGADLDTSKSHMDKKSDYLDGLISMLLPFSPCVAYEMNSIVSDLPIKNWPIVNYTKEDRTKYTVTINGKKKFEIDIPISTTGKEISLFVHESDAGKSVFKDLRIKTVFIPKGKYLINFVV